MTAVSCGPLAARCWRTSSPFRPVVLRPVARRLVRAAGHHLGSRRPVRRLRRHPCNSIPRVRLMPLDLYFQEGPMKIALICDRYPPRPHTGIGAFVQMLARGLHQRGHRVLVAEIGERYGEALDQGVPVFTLPRTGLRWAGNLITRLRLRNWLAARVRERAIDL